MEYYQVVVLKQEMQSYFAKKLNPNYMSFKLTFLQRNLNIVKSCIFISIWDFWVIHQVALALSASHV